MLKKVLMNYQTLQRKQQKYDESIQRKEQKYQEQKRAERLLLKDIRHQEAQQRTYQAKKLYTMLSSIIPLEEDVILCGIYSYLEKQLKKENFLMHLNSLGQEFLVTHQLITKEDIEAMEQEASTEDVTVNE